MTETITVTSRLHGERTFHLVEMQPYRRMDGTETTVRGWQATLAYHIVDAVVQHSINRPPKSESGQTRNSLT